MTNIERAGLRARRTLPGRPRRILAEVLRRRGLDLPEEATRPGGRIDAPIVAVIAHDGRKGDLLAFAVEHREALHGCRLIATATTGRMLSEELAFEVQTVLSGPLGGDAQIAGLIAEGCIDAVLFFVDPLSAHPHDPDIRTILRVCNVHDVPIAMNPASAAVFLASPLLRHDDERGDERGHEPGSDGLVA